MSALKVLFIGGSGQISSACSQRAVDLGLDLYVLNRGRTSIRPLPAGAHVLEGDIRDAASARAAIGEHEFDAVVDFVAFTPEHVQADIDLFAGRTGQYVFISSASAYQKPVGRLPIVESTPLRNPIWPYSQAKIACEELLVRAYREDGFPATIVRPSHTYDRTHVPFDGGWTVVDRMRRGKEVVVHGDGTSLWTLTHARRLRQGVRRPARPPAGDRRQLPHHLRRGADLEPDPRDPRRRGGRARPRIVHVPSDAILAADESWGRSPARRQGALGDLRQHQGPRRWCPTTWRRSRSPRARGRSSRGTTRIPRAGRSTRAWTR